LDSAEEAALAIDEVDGGWPPNSVELAGHVTGGVEEDGRDVPAFARGLPHRVRALPEADQQNFEALTFELPVYPIDGR
jgi:hypothetical protein